GRSGWAERRIAQEHTEQKRQEDTQDDRRHDRKIEREVPAPNDNVARQTAERDAEHHEQSEGRDRKPDQNEQLAHSRLTSTRCQQKSTRFQTPPSPARPIHGRRCARSTGRTPCAACPPLPSRGRSPPS